MDVSFSIAIALLVDVEATNMTLTVTACSERPWLYIIAAFCPGPSRAERVINSAKVVGPVAPSTSGSIVTQPVDQPVLRPNVVSMFSLTLFTLVLTAAGDVTFVSTRHPSQFGN
ncbi:hypothetical protein J6590_016887 [Homalodisca vitripennis]|nr:hypothetical protein J6590_016887 [Homalodisca vitripennis]